jgi:hypothetical protein
VQKILGLDKKSGISRATFAAPFVDGRLDVDAFDLHAITDRVSDSKKAQEAQEAQAAAAAAAAAASHALILPPPRERAADWRVYAGADLGGRCMIKVFFSTTTSSQKIRNDTQLMKQLMERHNYHKRPDFEPFTPVDIDVSPTESLLFVSVSPLSESCTAHALCCLPSFHRAKTPLELMVPYWESPLTVHTYRV